MSKLGLLCGVSGAGKSYILDRLDHTHFTTVELDPVIKHLYTELNVGEADGDPYLYQSWSTFLDSTADDRAVKGAFRDRILDLRGDGNASLLLIGNHLILPAMENVVRKALSSHFSGVTGFFLDVPAETVYRQRKECRKNEWDLKVSMEQVTAEVQRMRSTLPSRRYMVVSSQNMGDKLTAYFTVPNI
ncbi:hypothetical protein M4951_10330 [Blastopirellula sp. J2-11]|uniref:hypothetical protein n=1 Tax=Blastopirellula sp. J2-11 TaxID=2943192 RepID=UPI0021C9B6D3|nr:hypothetical protein [Blastopirellula sp. J2-11]UUO08695.1 hypothetical protein M4951_10330 [Blastopirellula sp. J2-11]